MEAVLWLLSKHTVDEFILHFSSQRQFLFFNLLIVIRNSYIWKSLNANKAREIQRWFNTNQLWNKLLHMTLIIRFKQHNSRILVDDSWEHFILSKSQPMKSLLIYDLSNFVSWSHKECIFFRTSSVKFELHLLDTEPNKHKYPVDRKETFSASFNKSRAFDEKSYQELSFC